MTLTDAATRPSLTSARTSSACGPGATALVSQDVLHGSCVAVASTVPSTTNCRRATGPVVCARQSTRPPIVEPSTTLCDSTFAAGNGVGVGLDVGFAFAFGFGFATARA